MEESVGIASLRRQDINPTVTCMITLAEKAQSIVADKKTNQLVGKMQGRQPSSFASKYGPWAIVTGASSGIGEEFARQLAAEGFNLVLAARRQQQLEQLADELSSKNGIKVIVVVVDLAKPNALEILQAATGDIEVGLLVNNAGIENHGPFAEQQLIKETRLIQLNVLAPMQLAHHFASKMHARKRGGIIFVSSAAGFGAWPYLANYAASKAYLLTLGESLHYELTKHGVDVTVLAPGLTRTAMADNIGAAVDFSRFPMKMMHVKDVVRPALSALGRKSSVIPGWINNIVTFVRKRILSRRGDTNAFGRLMDGAVRKANV